jgi:hypothetical protein
MCNPEINLRKLEKIHIYKKKRKVFGQDIGFCSLRRWQRERMASASNSDGIEPVDDVADGISTISSAFLNAHRLESMSLTTTWRWMRLLGFQNDTRKKSFFVDGHEREDVVGAHSIFCKRYLTDYELYCNCWVQISVDEANTINDLNANFGYSYFDIVGNQEKLEFHVDYWNQIINANVGS